VDAVTGHSTRPADLIGKIFEIDYGLEYEGGLTIHRIVDVSIELHFAICTLASRYTAGIRPAQRLSASGVVTAVAIAPTSY
jgi:hypothetical protein